MFIVIIVCCDGVKRVNEICLDVVMVVCVGCGCCYWYVDVGYVSC